MDTPRHISLFELQATHRQYAAAQPRAAGCMGSRRAQRCPRERRSLLYGAGGEGRVRCHQGESTGYDMEQPVPGAPPEVSRRDRPRDRVGSRQVLLLASVTHHNLYGLSVTVSDIDSSYTLGEMERVRREILRPACQRGSARCQQAARTYRSPADCGCNFGPGSRRIWRFHESDKV